MFRLVLVAFYLFFYLLFALLLYPVTWIIGRIDPVKKSRFSMKIAKGLFRGVIFLAGIHVNVYGEENIPEDHAVLFVGNHRSFFDIIVGYLYLKQPCGYVAKKELAKVPILAAWMKNISCLFLDRENIKEGLKTILAGIEQVKNGTSMWIFPEGTRNKEGDLPLLPFKEGSMKIAEKSGCPVVPVAMTHTAEVFEDHLPWIRSTTVNVWFGEPIDLSALSKEERKKSGAYVQGLLTGMIEELNAKEAAE